ncbi:MULTISPECIES: hypothetical protein [unclassified Nocardioides]|uniref:hypothetical protein n=1 Tax=unclassified Nocardioides TaxID=2615069 RepID=UPI0006F3E5B1|nr:MULTISPECIES: hypothetical protein [unclassified Nocardioides]KRA38596.1 hypothetical protein ASD81_08275 [Nocardioides sp. Root614]KRA92556.1 hypothetical protein ASD84_08540 [Nocardioides sp. Root682]
MLRRLTAFRARSRWVVVGLVVLLVAVAGVVTWRLTRDDASRFAAAAALAPASSERFSWTDWAGVREEVGADVSASSSTDELADFLLAAFDHDLSSATALEESAPTLHSTFGFSPANVDWELFAQGKDGAVVILGMPDDYDFDDLRSRLEDIGFEKPDRADGVWLGGVDLLETLDGPVTPELAALQIDEEDGIVFGSDEPSFLEERADKARGDVSDGVAAVIEAAGPALSASAYTGDQACSALSMGGADPADRTRAAELIEAAGEVHPMTGFAIAAQPAGDVRVAMAFESEDQARTDADSRSKLAAGPAPGQGGTFTERFHLGKVVAAGDTLTMDLEPVDDAFVMSDLNHGPVLFATC